MLKPRPDQSDYFGQRTISIVGKDRPDIEKHCRQRFRTVVSVIVSDRRPSAVGYVVRTRFIKTKMLVELNSNGGDRVRRNDRTASRTNDDRRTLSKKHDEKKSLCRPRCRSGLDAA